MTANYNAKLGLPYGVISGNSFPYLLDDIMNNGTDNWFESHKQETIEKLAKAIEEALEDSAWHMIGYNTQEKAYADCKDIAEEILDNADCEYQTDSDCLDYSYEDSDCKYQLGSLGGAPLIWVLESKYVMPCRHCSPCVPGAGDLDSYDPHGSYALCPDPDTLNATDEDTETEWYIDPHDEYTAEDGSILKIVHRQFKKPSNEDIAELIGEDSFKPREFTTFDDVPGDYCPIQGKWYPVIIAGKPNQVRLNYCNLTELMDSPE